ncbi:sugar phosphate isomerase [Arthrobacter frigidicola]|nr:sugar phosphate isomerase [Arthrobacter frigidicola]
MSTPNSNPAETGPEAQASASDPSPIRRSFAEEAAPEHGSDESVQQHMRDIAEVAAVEVITTSAVHLMSAAAVKCGLAAGDDAEELKDLDEARKLITALAGFVTAAAPEIGSQHAGPLRDGLRSLQLAFREASVIPDAPGKGPGEKFTGPVN